MRIPEMSHIHIDGRQDNIDVLQSPGCGNDHRPHQQNTGQYHYSLHQGGHAYGIKAAEDCVGHDYDRANHQRPLIGNLEEPGQDHADGDVLAHQVDDGDENANYRRSAANASRAVEAVGEIVLHRHVARSGGDGVQLGSEEQYADRSRERHEDLLPDAGPACGVTETGDAQDCHAAADAGHNEQSKGPEAQIPSCYQEIL